MNHDLFLLFALLFAAWLAERIAPASRKGGYSRSRAATPWDVASILRGKKGSNEPDTRGLLIVLAIVWTAAWIGGV